MRVQAGGYTDVPRLGGRHLFDFLERRSMYIISDKSLGPSWVLLGGEVQY